MESAHRAIVNRPQPSVMEAVRELLLTSVNRPHPSVMEAAYESNVNLLQPAHPSVMLVHGVYGHTYQCSKIKLVKNLKEKIYISFKGDTRADMHR